MADLFLPPNVEGLVSLFLRSQPELAELLGGPNVDAVRIYSALPDGVAYPAMRLVQYDAIPDPGRPLWLLDHYLQLDAWGGSKHDAFRLIATAMAAMSARLVGEHPQGVVTGVRFQGMRDLPDTEHAPAKPRWLVTAVVSAHPLR